jgi:hypothetical protein
MTTPSGPVGKLSLTLQDAMGNWFMENPCMGRGDVRAEVTIEALQRTETADYWVINRKRLYRADVMELMLDLTCSGFSIPAILAMPGMPKNRTYITWINEYKVFADLMDASEQMRALILSEQALEIMDDTNDPTGKQAFRDKTRAELRMRMAEVLHTKRYGKKQMVDVTHHNDDLSSPEVWSRFRSVLVTHAEMIESATGIKILVPSEVQDAQIVRPDEEGFFEAPDVQTLGMEGHAPSESDWEDNLKL